MSLTSSPPAPDGNEPECETENRDAIILYFEGNGDTTIRPAQPITLLKRPLRPQQPSPPKTDESGGPVAGA